MTDATSQADGHAPGAESARRANPDLDGTPGLGAAAGGTAPTAPDSGEASAWPGWPGVARPAGWFLPVPGEAAPPARPGMEPARADAGPEPDQPPGLRHSAGLGEQERDESDDRRDDPGQGDDQRDDSGRDDDQRDDPGRGDSWQEDPQPTAVYQVPQSWPESAVVGQTAALRGRAGGPGFAVSPTAVRGLYDPANRSGWQLAQQVWQESGINWEPPAEPSAAEPSAAEAEPEPGLGEDPRGGLPGQSWPAGAPDQAAPQPAFPAFPLGAPTLADTPALPGPETGARPVGSRVGEARPSEARQSEARPGEARPHQAAEPDEARPYQAAEPDEARPYLAGEPDELFRAWQGSVRQAASGVQPRTKERHRRAWQVARVGVPAAIIVTVGAGALMMLTGKTNQMLANRLNHGSPAPGARASAVVTAAPALASGAFPGYPGQRGTVTIRSLASAGGTWVAVGTADNHPAIWRRATGGTWTLVSATTPAVYQRPGVETLTSVAHGPAGWIAVGHVISGVANPQPIVVTSVDGGTWQPLDSLTTFAGPDGVFMGVTASRNGYVVVGRRVDGSQKPAAIWWSADLRNWVSGGNGELAGSLPSSTAYAVAATETGFVAVGSHGSCHTIWTSQDGRQWSAYDVPRPAGTSYASLREVTVNGTQVVAAGYAITKVGDVPIAVVSKDGGWHWHQIVLSAPGGLGSVLALSAAGHGFVAAGRAGPAAAPRAVTWSSPDGRSWSAAAAAGGGASQITALTASGSTVSGTAQQGADPFIVTVPSP
jgi:hypothetical protein